MKRLAIILSALLLSTISFAASTAVRDIDVMVELDRSGTAHVTEVWDVVVTEGTEWYLVRSNLGDIRISGLRVSDESGIGYVDEGEWDVDRSLAGKAGRCGIVTRRNGCEICWGVGSYGRHVFKVSYDMSNAVKGLNDYDMLHLQLVSPGLSSPPSHVKVTISASGQSLSEDNSRIWGFGYNGTMTFADGSVVGESTERFRYESSVIALIRFDKGIFAPVSMQDRDFSEALGDAMEGADFRKPRTLADRLEELFFALIAVMVWLGPLLLAFISRKVSYKKILGCNPKEVTWSRDLPYDGNILKSDYMLTKLGVKRKANAIASAMILDMINKGILISSRDVRDRVEISFNDAADMTGIPECERELYDMMKAASGADVILQDKEFSRWSASHTGKLRLWTDHTKSEGRSALVNDRYLSGGRYSPEAQAKARGLGFKKYLSDFTLVKERHTAEVALWKEYLVFAALFGIAEKVARELRDIDPVLYQEVVTAGYDPNLIYMTRNLANAITNATYTANTDTRAHGGFGGGTSFGGGGGFSGGGFGGEGGSGGTTKAFKVTGTYTQYGGNLYINTASAEGIESKTKSATSMKFNGGTAYPYCSDDCINSAGAINFNGAHIMAISYNNDAVDSNYGQNNSLVVTDGAVLCFSTRGGAEMGFDCDANTRITFKGGTLVAGGGSQGGSGSTSLGTGSVHYKVWSANLSYTANNYNTVTCNGKGIFTFCLPVGCNSSYNFYACSDFTSGQSHSLVRGTTAPEGGTPVLFRTSADDLVGKPLFWRPSSITTGTSMTTFSPN